VSVWDLATGEVVYTKRHGADTAGGITFLTWGPMFSSPVSKRPGYSLAFSVLDKVAVATIEYDFRVMRYAAALAFAATPSMGFFRTYTCALIDPTGSTLVAGTTTGEVAVYALRPALMYKSALMAASNGVTALTGPTGGEGGRDGVVVYVGGGDGSVRCFVGRDAAWTCTAEARMPGPLISLSIAASGTWLLAGTSSGRLVRLSWGCDLRAGVRPPTRGAAPARAVVDAVETSHTASVLAIVPFQTAADACATVSLDGTLRVWDLNSYACTWSALGTPAGAHPACVWVAPGGGGGTGPGLPCDLYGGFLDGSLRAFTPGSGSGGEAWRVAAHKGGVTAIAGNRAVVVTGGGDGKVNVWSRSGHDLLLSFHEHSKPVLGLVLDCVNVEIVHSLGADKAVHTYSMRGERRMRSHGLPAADAVGTSITCLAQAHGPNSEAELLAGTADGRVFVFDPALAGGHAGVRDLLASLVERARCGEGAPGEVPKAKPGQVRPELRLTGLRTSPSGAFLAACTACGRILILALAVDAPAPLSRPMTLPVFTDPSGTIRPALKSSLAGSLGIVAVHLARSVFTGIAWTADERQVLATSTDSSISVFNFYGSKEGR
jgi:WD40 repeat protein